MCVCHRHEVAIIVTGIGVAIVHHFPPAGAPGLGRPGRRASLTPRRTSGAPDLRGREIKPSNILYLS